MSHRHQQSEAHATCFQMLPQYINCCCLLSREAADEGDTGGVLERAQASLSFRRIDSLIGANFENHLGKKGARRESRLKMSRQSRITSVEIDTTTRYDHHS
eukprot:scaffold349_cov157-Skeletonema_dohrnii-CCMP3373.AAC.2